MMKRILTLLLLLAFVSVEMVDIVVLDMDHRETLENSGDSGLAAHPGVAHTGNPCGCDTLHHIFPTPYPKDPFQPVASARLFVAGAGAASSVDQGPPVPPPLA